MLEGGGGLGHAEMLRRNRADATWGLAKERVHFRRGVHHGLEKQLVDATWRWGTGRMGRGLSNLLQVGAAQSGVDSGGAKILAISGALKATAWRVDPCGRTSLC